MVAKKKIFKKILNARSSLVLDLSGMGLTEIPPGVFELTELTTLRLFNNEITIIPKEIGQLTQLITLSLYNNLITEIPKEIGQLTQLTEIYLFDNVITVIPKEMGQITQLITFSLPDNKITEIPKEIGQLTQLTTLDLSNNQITVIPKEIGQLTQLTTLSLPNNRITEIPKEIRHLTQLKTLDLSDNRIIEIPKEVGQLTQLKTLSVCHNGITVIPKEIGQLTQLTKLDLSENGITIIPKEIGQLTQITTLDFFNNQITAIPKEIGQLTQVTTLSLRDNQITAIPKEIGKLTQLTKLYLYSNQITAIPQEIGQLTQLTIFYIYSNQITAIPQEIGQLRRLIKLSLPDNKITEIPKEIGQLTQLTELDLSNNLITEVPKEIGQLTQLTTLYLFNNKINRCDLFFNENMVLERLFLHGNPDLQLSDVTLGPTWTAVQQGQIPASPRAILNFLAERKQGSQPLYEAKLIFVGRGEAGKTSLVKRLVTNTFNKREDITQGIQISDWDVQLDTAKRENIKLRIWDFGGQEILHSTHRLFLTSNCVYVLVLDHRANTAYQDATYWLNTIANFSKDVRVIVVLNKIKKFPFDINEPQLRRDHPMIQAILRTDCEPKTNNGIAELKKVILEQVNQVEDLRTQFPTSWTKIKDNLSGRNAKNDYIDYEQYQKLCIDAGENDPEKQKSLAEILQRLGLIINFAENARLSQNYVLNPHWLTKGIYAIIHNKDIKANGGWLELKDLSRILDSEAYPKKIHPYLIDLMRQFELCFGETDKVLIPELLSEQEPNDVQAQLEKPSLRLDYTYTLMPEGLIPRFLVRSRAMHEDDLRWRSGVVLKRGEARAVITGDRNKHRVSIRVFGETRTLRRDLLATIRYDFDTIHRDYQNLNPAEQVPLPGFEKHDQFVDLERLRTYETQGKPEFTHYFNRIDHTFDVLDLLYGADKTDGVDYKIPFSPRSEKISFDEKGRITNDGISVFLSYSHKDLKFKDQLDTFLKGMSLYGLFTTWNDEKIEPGIEWKPEILRQLERADIILLLISADFIASRFCYVTEMLRAFERHEADEAIVIPVKIRECRTEGHAFHALQGLPKPYRPVKNWTDRDKAWTSVANGIHETLTTLLNARGFIIPKP